MQLTSTSEVTPKNVMTLITVDKFFTFLLIVLNTSGGVIIIGSISTDLF